MSLANNNNNNKSGISKLPLISVITVVFNAVATVEQTILSIVSQEDANYEYIIVDGGSTDGTLSILGKYSAHLTSFVSEPDYGIYDAMNKGIQMARGHYIYFIGADDVLMPQVLNKISPYLKDDTIVYGNVLFKARNVVYDGSFGQLKIVTRNICHQCIFYPKEIFSTFKFNLKYKIYADYDLNLRLFNHQIFSFHYVPITIALFNDLGASGSNTIDQNFEADRISIIRKHFPIWVYLYRVLRSKAVKFLS